MSNYYNNAADSSFASIKAPLEPFSVAKVKVCPNCRGSLRNIARYGRLVRRGLLDESTKKFIVWSTRQYAKLGQDLIHEEEKLNASRVAMITEIFQPSELFLKGTRNNQINAIRKSWAGDLLKGLLDVRGRIKKHLKLVALEEQPFNKVANLVKYACKHHHAKGHYSFDDAVIQTKGYLQTFSLLLRCDIIILSRLAELINRTKDRKTPVFIDFKANKEDAMKLENLAKDSGRPHEQVESRIYHSQICAIEHALISNTAVPTKSTCNTVKRSECIRESGMQSL